MAKIEGIARRSSKKDAMELISEGQVSTELGLDGDYKGRARLRQLSVMRVEDWEAACQDAGCSLPWTARRANILVSGLEPFQEADLGKRLVLGEVTIEIVCETDPCDLMERTATGLKAALMPNWRGGVCGKVVEGGAISIGDTVSLSVV